MAQNESRRRGHEGKMLYQHRATVVIEPGADAQRKPLMPGYARICSNLPCQTLADLSIFWHKNERGAYDIFATIRQFLPISAHFLFSAAAVCCHLPS